jgi:hypothetical protein
MQARQRFGLIACALALACPLRANAASFSFIASDSASGTFSYGLLEATDNGGRSRTFTATSGSLVVISGPIAGTYTLFPNPDPPNSFDFKFGFVITADDLLLPNSNHTLDLDGLIFTGGGLAINIFFSDSSYSYDAFNGSGFTLQSRNAAFTLAETAAQQIQVLQSVVTELVDIGVKLPADGNSLQVKLNAALSAVTKGNSHAAIDAVNAFSNQVSAFIHNGTLTAAQGDPLVDLASALIGALGG